MSFSTIKLPRSAPPPPPVQRIGTSNVYKVYGYGSNNELMTEIQSTLDGETKCFMFMVPNIETILAFSLVILEPGSTIIFTSGIGTQINTNLNILYNTDSPANNSCNLILNNVSISEIFNNDADNDHINDNNYLFHLINTQIKTSIDINRSDIVNLYGNNQFYQINVTPGKDGADIVSKLINRSGVLSIRANTLSEDDYVMRHQLFYPGKTTINNQLCQYIVRTINSNTNTHRIESITGIIAVIDSDNRQPDTSLDVTINITLNNDIIAPPPPTNIFINKLINMGTILITNEQILNDNASVVKGYISKLSVHSDIVSETQNMNSGNNLLHNYSVGTQVIATGIPADKVILLNEVYTSLNKFKADGDRFPSIENDNSVVRGALE